MYGKYKVKLLIAVAYDMNNKFYMLCFAIVEEETNSNWSWFLDLLCRCVNEIHTKLCIILYRHAMIKNVMAFQACPQVLQVYSQTGMFLDIVKLYDLIL
jgi:hypothetical protein